MNKLKFAIIGCGRIADRHAEQINRLAVLQAVCDKVESGGKLGRKSMVQKFIQIIMSCSESEKDLDVISVCTPNGLHAEHSIKAFRNGLHVLCEKPMAIYCI